MVPSLSKKRKGNLILPYLPPLTNEIASILELSNLKPTYYPYLLIGRLSSNGKDIIPPPFIEMWCLPPEMP